MDYQEEYIDKNPDLHNSDIGDKIDAISQLLLPTATKFVSILDVACGSGRILLEISDKYQSEKTTGIDISQGMIKSATENDTDNRVEWRVENVFNLEPDNYELVLAIDVLEHLEDDQKFLEHIKDLGKFVVVKTPIEDNIINKLVKVISFGLINEYQHTENKYGHIHHYSQKDVDRLIEVSGLKTVSKKYMHLPRRSKLFWEILRIISMPLWWLSKPLYIKMNGGFLVLLLTKDNE